MSRRDNEQIGHVPKITPAHDEIASYQRNSGKSSLASSLGEVPDVHAGSSSVLKTVLAGVVMVLLLTAGLSAYMYQKLGHAEKNLRLYEVRIAQLEQRLSVTDESMNESSDALKEKAREMDSEIRKLWDNVWKKSKLRFAEFDKKLKQHEGRITKSDAYIASSKQQQSKNDRIVADLSSQLDKVKSTQTTVAANQQKLSRLQSSQEASNDKVNALNNSVLKLDRRVKDTEEWVESINGFRRQVNRDMTDLKTKLGSSLTTP